MKIIGISVRTTNQNGQAMQDIGNLWQRFFSEQILAKIPNKVSDAIYSIYTDYQKDYTEPYTCMIGVEVTTLSTIPDGLEGREFPEQTFEKFVAKGAMPQAVGRCGNISGTTMPRSIALIYMTMSATPRSLSKGIPPK